MSILAGIYNRRKDHSLQRSVSETLKKLISRNPEDKVMVFSDARCFLAKIDIGAYGEPAFHIDSSGSVSMLAGEPLLDVDDNDALRTRTQDLELLNQSWDRANWDLLARTRGVFCAVHYQPRLGRLHLISDKLGERPMYYWASDEYVIFSSVMRVLEGLAEVPKEMDLRAVTEITAFGYPLGDRTPYANIVRPKAGEVIQVTENSIVRSQYWRWDHIQPSSLSEAELLRETYEAFIAAVSRRIRKDKATLAFLSGGLDSRSIVAVLRAMNVKVHTFNFSPKGSQDTVYGAEFARRVGTFHHENAGLYEAKLDLDIWAPLPMALAEASRASNHLRSDPPERPHMVWSGDGGSVGLGHVYFSRSMIEPLRAGKHEEAINIYLKAEKAYVLTKLLKSDKASLLEAVPQRGIIEELEDIHCADPARGFHVFLMLNDQRRHLSHYYEHIDLHRFEFQLPFYDAVFLEKVLAAPIDLCLEHKFYTKWLSLFAPVTKAVPWQTYPGHEPCPLPIPKDLSYQWNSSSGRVLQKILKAQLVQGADEMLGAKSFPSQILNKWHLRLRIWMHRFGLRDYGYALQVAKVYYEYWMISGGKYVVASDREPSSIPCGSPVIRSGLGPAQR